MNKREEDKTRDEMPKSVEKIKKESNIERFVNYLVLLYFGQVRRENFYEEKAYDNIYNTVINQIQKRKEKEPDKAEDYIKMNEVVNKFYELMKDENIGREIKNNNIKATDFIKRYGDILGIKKREYDMSKLFNKEYIATIQDKKMGETRKALVYEEKKVPLKEIIDNDGNKVTIEQSGILYTKQWNGVSSYIKKYRITRQTGENEYVANDVYSNITIEQLEDPKYKDAVLQELISSNNIALSNAKGYIGEVIKTPQGMEEVPIEGEKMLEDGSYIYKINDKYSLYYDVAELSAVMLYEQQNNDKEHTIKTDESR